MQPGRSGLPVGAGDREDDPLTPAAAAACRDAIATRTWPGAAAAAARVPAWVDAAAGPAHTGSEPARAEPADGLAIGVLSCWAPLAEAGEAGRADPVVAAAAASLAAAAPAGGQLTAGRCQDRIAGTGTTEDRTGWTGTGFWAGTGRSRAGPGPPSPPGGPVMPVSSGSTSALAVHAAHARRRRVPRRRAAAVRHGNEADIQAMARPFQEGRRRVTGRWWRRGTVRGAANTRRR